jgi:hypothetical protein
MSRSVAEIAVYNPIYVFSPLLQFKSMGPVKKLYFLSSFVARSGQCNLFIGGD